MDTQISEKEKDIENLEMENEKLEDKKIRNLNYLSKI